jgi:hypothetical protein
MEYQQIYLEKAADKPVIYDLAQSDLVLLTTLEKFPKIMRFGYSPRPEYITSNLSYDYVDIWPVGKGTILWNHTPGKKMPFRISAIDRYENKTVFQIIGPYPKPSKKIMLGLHETETPVERSCDEVFEIESKNYRDIMRLPRVEVLARLKPSDTKTSDYINYYLR